MHHNLMPPKIICKSLNIFNVRAICAFLYHINASIIFLHLSRNTPLNAKDVGREAFLHLPKIQSFTYVNYYQYSNYNFLWNNKIFKDHSCMAIFNCKKHPDDGFVWERHSLLVLGKRWSQLLQWILEKQCSLHRQAFLPCTFPIPLVPFSVPTRFHQQSPIILPLAPCRMAIFVL